MTIGLQTQIVSKYISSQPYIFLGSFSLSKISQSVFHDSFFSKYINELYTNEFLFSDANLPAMV